MTSAGSSSLKSQMETSREWRQTNLPLFVVDGITVYVANIEMKGGVIQDFHFGQRRFTGYAVGADTANAVMSRLLGRGQPYISMTSQSYQNYENPPPTSTNMYQASPDQGENRPQV